MLAQLATEAVVVRHLSPCLQRGVRTKKCIHVHRSQYLLRRGLERYSSTAGQPSSSFLTPESTSLHASGDGQSSIDFVGGVGELGLPSHAEDVSEAPIHSVSTSWVLQWSLSDFINGYKDSSVDQDPQTSLSSTRRENRKAKRTNPLSGQNSLVVRFLDGVQNLAEFFAVLRELERRYGAVAYFRIMRVRIIL